MTGESAKPLLAAALQVNVFAAADRIVENPEREASSASAADVLALAAGVTNLTRLMLETALLVKALRLKVHPDSEREAKRGAMKRDQLERVEQLLLELAHESTQGEAP